jgi:hypothetical protein
MTIVQRNTSDSEKRSYAAVAAIPVVPVAVQNSFSALQDDSSESELDLAQFDWKTIDASSESNESDTAEDSATDSANDSANNSDTDSASDTSQEELIVNQKHYRRLRPAWCKDGVPCFVTSLVGFLGVAYFMQFVFYICGLTNDNCCSPASRLQCSKGL